MKWYSQWYFQGVAPKEDGVSARDAEHEWRQRERGEAASNASGAWEGVDLHDFYRERLTVTHLQNLVLVTLYVLTFLLAPANSMALLVFWR
ncbi:hypothetical protein CEXT_116231 [Caerostris extrusa]|uniref:Uncharacterized protein n=1 Tax=Caerostris extrusa TaxID=172846 RepID=A0AAV4TIW4_CAEEX|nr:hypothetical protein CEXT_116231 [Caerostris extrusa]